MKGCLQLLQGQSASIQVGAGVSGVHAVSFSKEHTVLCVWQYRLHKEILLFHFYLSGSEKPMQKKGEKASINNCHKGRQ